MPNQLKPGNLWNRQHWALKSFLAGAFVVGGLFASSIWETQYGNPHFFETGVHKSPQPTESFETVTSLMAIVGISSGTIAGCVLVAFVWSVREGWWTPAGSDKSSKEGRRDSD